MIPKLIININSKAKEPSKEDLLRSKIDELLRKNEEMKKELEELKNMI